LRRRTGLRCDADAADGAGYWKNRDEARYARLFEKIRSAFEKQFVHGDGFVAGADNNEPSFGVINNPGLKVQGGDTQTGYVLALHMSLLPENLRAAAANGW